MWAQHTHTHTHTVECYTPVETTSPADSKAHVQFGIDFSLQSFSRERFCRTLLTTPNLFYRQFKAWNFFYL